MQNIEMGERKPSQSRLTPCHREQTERVVAVGDWGSSPPATQKTPAGADVFVWCIILYSFPHCLPVKNRRVVVARNTLPARSTVVGNSGCEGLQG